MVAMDVDLDQMKELNEKQLLDNLQKSQVSLKSPSPKA
jgi:hypothetical protein